MADAADLTTELVAVELSATLSRIPHAIPPGVSGECDECGEIMPRLVGGRCGFCRDGRRPPLSAYDRLQPVQPDSEQPEETDMTSTPKPSANAQTIAVPAKDGVLHAIRQRAAERALPLGQAAITLIEEGIVAAALAAPDYVELAQASVEELLEELHHRLLQSVDADELTAAVARADEAERKLAAIGAMFRAGTD